MMADDLRELLWQASDEVLVRDQAESAWAQAVRIDRRQKALGLVGTSLAILVAVLVVTHTTIGPGGLPPADQGSPTATLEPSPQDAEAPRTMEVPEAPAVVEWPRERSPYSVFLREGATYRFPAWRDAEMNPDIEPWGLVQLTAPTDRLWTSSGGAVILGKGPTDYFYGKAAGSPSSAGLRVDVLGAAPTTTCAGRLTPVNLGRSPSEVAATLASADGVEVTRDPVAGKYLGYDGVHMVLRVEKGYRWTCRDVHDDIRRDYLLLVGDATEVTVVDVGGTLVLLQLTYYADTPRQSVTALRALSTTIEILPNADGATEQAQ